MHTSVLSCPVKKLPYTATLAQKGSKSLFTYVLQWHQTSGIHLWTTNLPLLLNHLWHCEHCAAPHLYNNAHTCSQATCMHTRMYVHAHTHLPTYVHPSSTPHPRHRCTNVHIQTYKTWSILGQDLCKKCTHTYTHKHACMHTHTHTRTLTTCTMSQMHRDAFARTSLQEIVLLLHRKKYIQVEGCNAGRL